MSEPKPTAVPLPKSEQFYMNNEQGLEKKKKRPFTYIVDGNALFLTATEAAWRCAPASHFAGGVSLLLSDTH
ncbi:esterase [Penicillium mononematosum]|uniref:esterase n=1 Tax=Penicillium mononematosum TaxID=268346 RepID=UPI00254865A8|nr:esterase [Penicillium mononematosum]KAJ6179192.1 esterase [Penicillium mononematosum]